MKQSSQKKVVLLNMSLKATGLYECYVLEEEPEFNEAKKGANLTVVGKYIEKINDPRQSIGEGNLFMNLSLVIPTTKPVIEPAPSEGLHPGSEVNLNCTAAPSIPEATLEWHINDNPVGEMRILLPSLFLIPCYSRCLKRV